MAALGELRGLERGFFVVSIRARHAVARDFVAAVGYAHGIEDSPGVQKYPPRGWETRKVPRGGPLRFHQCEPRKNAKTGDLFRSGL